MTKKDSLHEIISTLISRRIEGTYWDFKRKHHDSKAELIRDVLCLANIKHTGNRYLIFGVDNRNFSLHPINKDSKRRTLEHLADLFNKNAGKFFQSRFPDFYLKEITIDGTLIDVLVIEDSPHKPYYLVKEYGKKNSPPPDNLVLPAHHIYSRICNTNTPVDDVAPPHEIERMWRERFGLDMPPLERAKRYLSEPEAWSPMVEKGCNMNFHHTTFPEFTLKFTDPEDRILCDDEWTRGEIRTDNNHIVYCDLHYHQTRLAHIPYVNFDDHKKSMVAPTWKSSGAGRFYYYEADSIDYAVQKFYSTIIGRDDSFKLLVRGRGKASDEARSRWGHSMRIPVLRAGEVESFLGFDRESEFVAPNRNKAKQYELFLRNQLDFEDWRFSQELRIL